MVSMKLGAPLACDGETNCRVDKGEAVVDETAAKIPTPAHQDEQDLELRSNERKVEAAQGLPVKGRVGLATLTRCTFSAAASAFQAPYSRTV